MSWAFSRRRLVPVLMVALALLAAPLIQPTPAAAATTGSISGVVFEDMNGNGTQDGSDANLSGRTVFADANSNGTLDGNERSATTTGAGTYLIDTLDPGSYNVVTVLPAGSITTTPSVPATVVSNVNTPGADVGVFRLGKLSGAVFGDTNGNGFRNGGETGIAGVTVFLDGDGDNYPDPGERTLVSGPSGVYEFDALTAGTYVVRVVVPSGNVQTNPNPGGIVISSGAEPANIDFGLFARGSVAGIVYYDLDGNGTRDAGEPGYSGATVWLDNNHSGAPDGGEPTTITDGAGAYSFASLFAGTYQVSVLPPTNYAATSTNPMVQIINSATYASGVDFGISNTAVIAGTVFDDVNSNGILDAGEHGSPSRTVYLDTNDNGVVNVGEPTATTDVDGNYVFTGLTGSSYRPKVVIPNGTTLTTALPGVVNTAPGVPVRDVRFGLFTQGAISGVAFTDTNGNGTRDVGEDGSASKIVFLDNNNNGSLSAGEPSVTTDANGAYAFLNLANGSYRPRVVIPGGSRLTSTVPSTVGITSGTAATGVDFGLFVNGSISGTLFNDGNANGIKDSGDNGVAARVVFIDSNNDGDADVGEPTFSTTTLGAYTFSNLGPGTYHLRTTLPNGVLLTSTLPAPVVIASGNNVTGVDFGTFTKGTISGTVYNDTNGNGVKNAGELGIASRTVFIDTDNSGTLDPGEVNTLTGSTGTYTFPGLTVGSYRIRMIVPVPQTHTSANPAPSAIVSGSNITAIDFGLFAPASITGTVYEDVTGNAQMNAGDQGIGTVTVYVDVDNNGALDVGEPSAVTATNGAYSISGLGPGSYRVRMVTPAGRSQTTPNPAAVSPPSGGASTAVNFGLFTFASVAGNVFNDLNGNGTKEAGETNLAGRTVYLDNNANSAFDLGEPNLLTDQDGNYAFTGLTMGSYRTRTITPSGWLATTTPPAASSPTSGAQITNVDFGSFAYATLAGFVFDDINGNGAQDSGEAGLSGRTLFIDANNNGVLNAGEVTTLTDLSGNYAFNALGPGTFQVKLVVPGTSLQMSVNPPPVVSTSGATFPGRNFAIFVKASITGLVYNDVNGSGTRESTDAGAGSRTLYLDLNGNDVVDSGEPTTTTNAAGSYSFTGLGPATYRVRTALPANTIQTSTSPAPITVLSGSTNANFDFATFTLASITGTVYNDLNGNGQKAAGEAGIGGRTVFIDADDDGVLDGSETSASTAATGVYTFTGLRAGNYRIRMISPVNTVQTSVNPAVITASSATNSLLNDFGSFTFAALTGSVYNDVNGNGTKGTGELGKGNITVFLDDNGNSELDAGERSTVTDNAGVFRFDGLSVGSYRVRVDLPQFTVQTSVALPLVSPLSGATASGNNIGVFTQGRIGGTVFGDNNGNATMDAGEAPVAGAVVFMDTNGNNQLGAGEPSVVADENGDYLFDGLGLGSYKPRVVVTPGTITTTPLPAAIAVTSGTDATSVRFGMFTAGTINGSVYSDSNGNGVRDGNEPGSSGRIVFMDTDNDGVKDPAETSVTTSATGTFSFGNLVAGSVRLRVVMPNGMSLTTTLPAPINVVSGTVSAGHEFGLKATSSATTTTTTTTPGTPPTTVPTGPIVDPVSTGGGYWMATADGNVFNYGSARNWGNATGARLSFPIVGMASLPSGGGYNLVASDGGIFSYGDARFLGSMGGKPLNRPIVGMANTPTGNGYWMVASDGGIFSFGDARFFGSTGAIKLNKPIVGMSPTASGNGYWLVASDGGIFAYGDAAFFGSTGSIALNQPIVGMAASGTTGYWLVASDGGIFAFGSARFWGSTGNLKLNQPIVGMRAPADGNGYWMFARDGGVFAFGSARFFGGTPSTRSPVVN